MLHSSDDDKQYRFCSLKYDHWRCSEVKEIFAEGWSALKSKYNGSATIAFGKRDDFSTPYKNIDISKIKLSNIITATTGNAIRIAMDNSDHVKSFANALKRYRLLSSRCMSQCFMAASTNKDELVFEINVSIISLDNYNKFDF